VGSLLDFLHSNSFWDGERLETNWRQPFDILAESPSGPPSTDTPEGDPDSGFAQWRPLQDSNLLPLD